MNIELKKKIRISQILLTLGAFEFFGPILRDTNSSHLLNPEWVGHARFHLMWCIALWGSLGIYSLILIWRKTTADTGNLYTVIYLQFLNALAFWTSTLLSDFFGGDIFDAKIHTSIGAINENILVFTLLSLFLFFNFWFLKRKIDPFLKDKISTRESNQSKHVTQVLISGAGPAGMIAAIYLSKLGIKNILIERRGEIQSHPKAHELSARSLEILRTLGIPVEDLIKEASDSETASRILFCNTINDEIGRIDLNKEEIRKKYNFHLESQTPFLNLSQTELERVLRKHLSKISLTTILLEHQWISALEKDGNVHSEILDRKTGDTLEIKSKYLICADGARSDARAHLGINMSGPERIQDVVNAYFTNDMTSIVKTKAKLYWIFNPQAPGVFIAHHPKKRWVYHHAVETRSQKIESFDEEYFQKKMRIAMGLKEDFKFKIESISNWRMSAQIADRFRKGNIFLIGDAAHRFPPTGGLGMNSGIGDAQNLSWKIASVLKGEGKESLLETYETERMPILKENCKQSLKNWKKILEIPKSLGLSPFLGRMMDRFLHARIVRWLPKEWISNFDEAIRKDATAKLLKNKLNPKNMLKAARAIANQIGHFDRIGLDLGYRYQSSQPSSDIHPESSVSIYRASTAIGARFPHFWLDENKKISSHSLLSPTHFTLLVFKNSIHLKFWESLKSEDGMQMNFEIQSIPELSETARLTIDIGTDGALLLRPDGHVAWKIKNVLDDNQVRSEFLEVTHSILDPKLSRTSQVEKIRKGKIKMLTLSILILLPILLFTIYLFRPLTHKPAPATFKALSLSEGRFESFVAKPSHIYGMGLVYSKHIMETAASFDPAIPPPIFKKEIQSLNQNAESVVLPKGKILYDAIMAFEPELKENESLTNLNLLPLLDYEVELAFVILKDIEKADLEKPEFAPQLGYFIANDLSARSLAVFGEGKRNKAEYWGVSKSFKGFLPISKKMWIPNVHLTNSLPDIKLETYVNGNLRQSENTVNMIYTPKEMLRFIQNKYPDAKLKKGDIVITGTPGGVALSTPKALARLFDLLNLSRFTKLKLLLKKENPRFLQIGDEVLVRGVGLGEVKVIIR